MSDHEAKTSELPNTWQEIQPDAIYQSLEGRLVSFNINQIKLGILYDPIGKHLRAINKGLVPPKGNTGLVPSEEPGYDFKSKIQRHWRRRRFHGKVVEGILHFPGKQTTH